MHPALMRFSERLTAAGLDGAQLAADAGNDVVAHVTGDPAPWLSELESLFLRVRTRPDPPLWSLSRTVVPSLLPVVGQDVEVFRRLLRSLTELSFRNRDFRLEQQGLSIPLHALAGRLREAEAFLDGASRLVDAEVEPGWFCQFVGEALAKAPLDAVSFTERWQRCVDFACEVHRSGSMHVGSPLSVGLAALVSRVDATALTDWLEVLKPIARTAGRQAYGLFEYGLPGLAQGALSAGELTMALRLTLAMLDHGLAPTPTLQALSDPLALELATRLADAGVDPAIVITNGVRIFGQLGWLDDGGERLARLAIELHRRGLRQLVFEDGLEVLPALEHEYGGLGLRALELIETMVEHDLEPGVVMRWSLPRTLPFLKAPWAAEATLQFARALAQAGVPPEPAVMWAVRPLVSLSPDAASFERLSTEVLDVVRALTSLGADATEVLFSDVAKLAETGEESQAFRALLTRFSAVVSRWAAKGLDAKPLLSLALPAAAREASGRPWVLSSALDAVLRLIDDDRSAEALALLEVGVATAVRLGPSGADDFSVALRTVEQRYSALPPSLTRPGSAAASAVAGTDVERLASALELLALAHQRHGAALDACADVLPELARVAGTVDGLGRLIDVLIEEQPRLGPALFDAVSVVAKSTSGAERGATALRALSGALETHPERRDSLRALLRLRVPVEPEALPTVLAQVHQTIAASKERAVVLDFLEQARTLAVVEDMARVLPPLLKDPRPALLDGLARAKELVSRLPNAWTELVAPALQTAKQHAGPVLSALRAVPGRHLEQPADLRVARRLVTQQGVRAVDLLWNLVLPALRMGTISSLSQHEAWLDTYLAEVGFADAEVYAHFVRIQEEAGPDRAARVAALRQEIGGLTRAIRAGEASETQRRHPLFAVALQHVFPAAVSATKESWTRLVETMPDRPQDVTALFVGGHRAALQMAEGSWQLVEHATGLEVFDWGAQVLPSEDEAVRPLEALGWELLTAWSEGCLARTAVKQPLTRALLAQLPAESRPPSTRASAGELLALRDLASDRLATLVEQAVLAARAQDAARVERLARVRLAPPARVGAGLVKAVAGTLQSLDAGRIDDGEAHRRLEGQLQAFELPDDLITFVRGGAEALRQLRPRPVVLEPGKEVARVHAELVGQELSQMNAVLAKALVYRPSSQVVSIEVEVSKRALHAPAGLTAGVCVAPDVQLWNTPGFLHCLLWRDGVCVGDVHLLVLEEAGQRFLCLPGINPSLALLEALDVDVLVVTLLDHLRALAKQVGLSALWVPVSPAIHSNRRAVGDALVALKLPVRATRGHPFSFSPYAYRVEEVWTVSLDAPLPAR